MSFIFLEIIFCPKIDEISIVSIGEAFEIVNKFFTGFGNDLKLLKVKFSFANVQSITLNVLVTEAQGAGVIIFT